MRAVGACALPLRAAAGSRGRTAAVAHGEGWFVFLIVFFADQRVMEVEINQEQVGSVTVLVFGVGCEKALLLEEKRKSPDALGSLLTFISAQPKPCSTIRFQQETRTYLRLLYLRPSTPNSVSGQNFHSSFSASLIKVVPEY
jgi:hypothetical protein